MGVSLAGVECLVPAQLYRDCVALGRSVAWAALANSYECPRGAAPGDAWLVMSRAALSRLDPGFEFAGDYDLTFSNDNVAGPQAPPVVVRNLVFVGAECLVPGHAGDDAPYLARLADRRLLVNRRYADAAYNVRDRLSGELIAPTLDGGTAWTWQDVLQDLWTAAGLGDAPALPVTPDAEPENLQYYQTPALEAVEHFLQRVGCELIYDPIADTFGVADDGAADPAHDAAVERYNAWRVADACAVVPGRTARPGACRVLFPRVPHVAGQGSPWYAVDVDDPEGAGEPGTLSTIHDELAALAASGTPPNSAELTARAEARAADYFAMLSAADRARLAWPLPLADAGLRPGSRVKSVRWSHQVGAGTRTELRRQDVVERTRAVPLSTSRSCCPTHTVRTEQSSSPVDGVTLYAPGENGGTPPGALLVALWCGPTGSDSVPEGYTFGGSLPIAGGSLRWAWAHYHPGVTGAAFGLSANVGTTYGLIVSVEDAGAPVARSGDHAASAGAGTQDIVAPSLDAPLTAAGGATSILLFFPAIFYPDSGWVPPEGMTEEFHLGSVPMACYSQRVAAGATGTRTAVNGYKQDWAALMLALVIDDSGEGVTDGGVWP